MSKTRVLASALVAALLVGGLAVSPAHADNEYLDIYTTSLGGGNWCDWPAPFPLFSASDYNSNTYNSNCQWRINCDGSSTECDNDDNTGLRVYVPQIIAKDGFRYMATSVTPIQECFSATYAAANIDVPTLDCENRDYCTAYIPWAPGVCMIYDYDPEECPRVTAYCRVNGNDGDGLRFNFDKYYSVTQAYEGFTSGTPATRTNWKKEGTGPSFTESNKNVGGQVYACQGYKLGGVYTAGCSVSFPNISANKDVTWVYRKQFSVTVGVLGLGTGLSSGADPAVGVVNLLQTGITLTPSTPTNYTASAAASVTSGNDRYSLAGWQILTSGTSGIPVSTEGSSSFTYTLNTNESFKWLYSLQHKVTVGFEASVPQAVRDAVTASLSPAAGEQWVNHNVTKTFTAPAEVTVGATVYSCTGWVGTGDFAAGGEANSVGKKITQLSAISWKYEPVLTVQVRYLGLPGDPDQRPAGYLDRSDIVTSGDTETLTAAHYVYSDCTVALDPATCRFRYILERWSGTGDFAAYQGSVANPLADGVESVTATVSGNSVFTWYYRQQVRLKVEVSGTSDPALADPVECPYIAPSSCTAAAETLPRPKEAATSGVNFYDVNTQVTVTAEYMLDDGGQDRTCRQAILLEGVLGSSAQELDQVRGRRYLAFYVTVPTIVQWRYDDTAVWVIGQEVPPTDAVGNPIVPAGKPLITLEKPGVEGDTADTAFFWSIRSGKLYAVHPVGSASVTWTESGTGTVSTTIGYTIWPPARCSDATGYEGCLQSHLAQAPVTVNPAKDPPADHVFREIKFTENEARVEGGLFRADRAGRSVLLFVDNDEGSTDTALWPVSFVVVDTVGADASPDRETQAWHVGTAVSWANHADPEGKSGYTMELKGPYDGSGSQRAYDRVERSGPIIPVNTGKMTVAWYRTESLGLGWPVKPVEYQLQWPPAAEEIVIASGNGALLQSYEYAGMVYVQNDKALPGYNPNEEHALILGSRVYALRSDLNSGATSEPYVLVKYTDPAAQTWAMRVFKVLATNAEYGFDYLVRAGKPILPPTPLDILPAAPQSGLKGGEDATSPWYYRDHKGGHWARASSFTSYEVTERPWCVVDADYTLDGNQDLFVVGAAGGQASLLEGRGDGSFAPAQTVYAPAPPPGTEVKVDLNKDGILDAVRPGLDANVYVRLGKIDGTYKTEVAYAAAGTIQTVAAADLDGDGKTDLVAGRNNGSVYLFAGKGDGTFNAPTNYSMGSNVVQVLLANLDGNWLPDVIAVNPGRVSVRLNKGDGTLLANAPYFMPGTDSAVFAVAADLSGDGMNDLAVGADVAHVFVLINNGSGAFGAYAEYFPADVPSRIEPRDLNADGALDLVVFPTSVNQLSVFRNAGTGTFGAPGSYAIPALPSSAVPAAVPGREAPVLVVFNADGSASLLVNEGDGTFRDPVPCVPQNFSTNLDANNDGNVDEAQVNGRSPLVSVLLGNAAGTATWSTVDMHWWYPLQRGFWYPDSSVTEGMPVPFLNSLGQPFAGSRPPQDVRYRIGWPGEAPALKTGETLTRAKYGLPNVLSMAAVKVVFDQNVHAGGGPLAKLFDPLGERSVFLAAVPGEVGTEMVGGRLFFTDLPYFLAARLSYDPAGKKLIFAGLLDERGLGEPLLLPNVMTVSELTVLQSADRGAGTAWDNAVASLFELTRNPAALNATQLANVANFYNPGESFPDFAATWGSLIGLGTDESGAVGPAALVGVAAGLTAGAAAGEGFLVLAENDDESLGSAPVDLKVIRVAGSPYVGEIKVIAPENVFDEKLTLRHSGDFGGDPERFYFVWYYKPDSSGLPPALPSGPQDTDGWVKFDREGLGVTEVTIEGAGKLTLSDNWIMAHYYYGTPPGGGAPAFPAVAEPPCKTGSSPPSCDANIADPKEDQRNWSGWAGAPGNQTAQLAPGWIKRVVEGLNPFDARVKDFRSYMTSTQVSMIEQLGQRYEGDIALNPDGDNLNAIGLIEAYETVIRRAMKFSIDADPPTDYGPVNNALLNAATRVADFYSLLGNEAYADALDPTIGFDTASGALGNMAPAVFAFQNQLDSLLDEELVLLRGRDDSLSSTRARPVYNRLIWNFTGSEGEVAYVQTYNLSDRDYDGFITAEDGKIMFPQGHGDAWGHYLSAMSSWYRLLRNGSFTWEPRAESVLVGNAPVPVDFLDERKFAKAAATRARVGAEIVDLTYRQHYVDDPAGQWQGYKDTDAARAWGVDEWGRRAGQGAYFDWALANAMLPATDPNPAHEGITKIDRTTVRELAEVASQFAVVQGRLNNANRGLNPLGLARGVVPFDIDPSLLSASGGRALTHFEQINDRALKALENTRKVFDFANQYTLMLRQNADTLQDFAGEVWDQEVDYKNRLIELFGYPYAGDIGGSGVFPEGYDGPDWLHFMYVDLPDLTGEPAVSGGVTHYTATFNFDDENFDPELGITGRKLDVTYALPDDSPWMPVPAGWGRRRAPGSIQMALSEAIKSHADYARALTEFEGILSGIESARDLLEAKFGILASQIQLRDEAYDAIVGYDVAIAAANTVKHAFERAKNFTTSTTDAIVEALPKIIGMSNDPGAAIRGTLKGTSSAIVHGLEIGSSAAELSASFLGTAKDHTGMIRDRKLALADARFEVQQMIKELEGMDTEAVAKQQELYLLRETIQQNVGAYYALLAEALRTLDEREIFRQSTAAEVQGYRYQDMAFRVFRNEAIQKYRAQFDLAARYAYLAATAYDYETNLLGDANGSGRTFLADIVRQRALGSIIGGQPVAGQPGLADPVARLTQNFEVYKGQLGFNNPQTEGNRFSLKGELFRLRADSHEEWRSQLREHVVADLWRVPEFRRFCRPFTAESAGPQPGLVIDFDTRVVFGKNFFGWPLSGGDSAYDPTNFATKIRGVGVWLENYQQAGLSNTPRVYLLPVGADVLRSPSDDTFMTREWRVVDQKLPVPFTLGEAGIRAEDWIPINDSLSDEFGGIRRFSSFRAYHDSGEAALNETIQDSRLVGRSVWNTKWLLVIPGGTLFYDQGIGLEKFIDAVSDIKLWFQTYAYSGN